MAGKKTNKSLPQKARKNSADIKRIIKGSINLFRLIAENSPDIFTVFDMEFNVIYVNPAIEKLRGFTPAEAKKQKLSDILLPHSLNIALSTFKEELEAETLAKSVKNRSRILELEHYRKDGSTVWLETHASFIRDEKNKPVAILVISRDISHRKEIEAKLRMSEEWYRALFETSPDAIVIYDFQGNIIHANKRTCELYGVHTVGELIANAHNVLNLLSDGEKEKAVKNIANALQSGHSSGNEYRARNIKGETVFLEIHSSVLPDKDGKPQAFVSIIRDISARKQMEETIKAREQQYRTLVETAKEGIWRIENHITTYVNTAMAEMLGYTPEEMLGKSIFDFMFEEDIPALKKRLQEKREKGIDEVYEDRRKKKDGSELWAIVSAKSILDETGRYVGSFALYTDITERKKKEKQLQESEERYRNLTEITQDAIVLHDMNGIVQYINNAGITLSGYSREEIIGKNILMFVPKEYRRSIFARHQKRIEGFLEVEQYETEFLNRAGMKIPVFATSTPIVKEGRIEAIMVVAHDMTERKKSEELARLNKQRLEATISVLQYEAKTTTELFQHVLDEAISITGSKIGFALNYDGTHKLFTLNAWSKDVMAECAMIEKPEIYRLDEAGIWAETIRQRRPIIINNYEEDNPLKRGYPEGHVALKRYMGIPIFKNEEIIATVGVANKESDYTEIDVLQLTLLMDAAWKSIDRMQIMQALQESEEKFRTLSNSSPAAIMLFQNDRFVYINPEAERMSGYSAEEAYTMNFWSIVHPDDVQEIIRRGEKRQSGRSAENSVEFRIITRDGTVKWVYLTAASVNYGGKPAALVSAIDITDRKKTEEALLEEKERLRITLQSIGDGVIATDISEKVIIINAQGQKLTGWSQEEAEGKLLQEIFVIQHEFTGQPLDNPVEKVLQTGRIYELSNHTVLIARDGTRRIIADSAAPIKDKDGRIFGVVLVFRDMTEKRQLLEQAQRSQRLESIGVLAGGIAHDFNNILEGVFGYLGLAALNIKDEKTAEMINNALKSIQRAKGLTGQLLTFAKGGEPVKKNQSVIPIVRDTVQFATSGSNVRIEFNFAEHLNNAEFDANQISQVIENITLNALQAMPQGGTISVQCHNAHFSPNEHPLLSGEYVKISIRDQGIGIPGELLMKIFDPFFTTKSKGQGLGLATSYSIISRHRGTIEVESESGKGTAFHIYLPAVEKISEEEISPQKKRKLSGGKILILDDEAVMQDIMMKFLEHLGFTAKVASEGKQAIDIFLEEREAGTPFDALIFDMTIKGGMSGKDTIVEIRKIDPTIPAFVMSGYSDDPALSHPDQYGFNGSLSKPFKLEELEGLLARYFAASRG